MSVLRQRLRMHMRLGYGSNYLHDILDDTSQVVGSMSTFVPRNPASTKGRTVYTLGERDFVDDYNGFVAAVEAQREQQRRDAEWNAAAPESAEAKP